jgi:hypothetical protein
MGMKLDLTHYGRSIDTGDVRTGFSGEYLGQRGSDGKLKKTA